MEIPDEDSPEMMHAKNLLDKLPLTGFQGGPFNGEIGAPLVYLRETLTYRDTVFIDGFHRNCWAWREHKSRLILPVAVTELEINGGAIRVLTTVLGWPTSPS